MRTQRCTQCGSKLNISKMEEGSKFACFNCGTILVAGQHPKAVKRSLSDGPVFQPAAKREDEAATPTLSRTSRRPAAAPVAGKSKGPMLMGIGAVVVVGVVVAIMAGGGGGDDVGGGGGGSGGGRKASSQTSTQWWAQTSGQVETANASELRAFLGQAASRGYDKAAEWPEMANEIFAALLKQEPDDARANKHFGRKSLLDYPEFRGLWSKMIDNFKVLPKEPKAFLSKYEDAVESGKKVWMDDDEYAAASATLAAFSAWTEKLKSDPSIMQIEKGRMRASGELKEFDAGAAVSRPFVLFVGYRKDPGKTEGQREPRAAVGAKHTGALKVMVDEFEKRFRAPMNLPALDVNTALYMWMFETKGDYDNLARTKPLFGAGGDVLGGFSVKSRWSYATISPDKAQAKFSGNDLAHTAAYQLQWHFSRDPKKTFLNYFEEWNGLWFTIGFAGWLGGGIDHDPATGVAKWTGIDPRRAAHLKHMRENGVPWVTLRELTQIESWEGFRRWIGDTWFPQLEADEDLDEETIELINQSGRGRFAVQLLFAQAWGLAHFMNENDPAKYKDLLLTALRGKRKPQKYVTDRLTRWRKTYTAFAEIMGLKSDDDWDKLSKAYEKHLDKLAR